MRLCSIRLLALSLGVGLVAGSAIGALYALAADKLLAYGLGTGLFVVGLAAFGLGTLGATEPKRGWASTSRGSDERRGLLARLVAGLPDGDDEVSSLDLAVWGVVVGGGLIASAMVAFSLAVS